MKFTRTLKLAEKTRQKSTSHTVEYKGEAIDTFQFTNTCLKLPKTTLH